MRTAYGLREAFAVTGGDGLGDGAGHGQPPADLGEAMRRRLGAIAAEYLTELVTDGDVLGLACSRTLNAMTHALTSIATSPAAPSPFCSLICVAS